MGYQFILTVVLIAQIGSNLANPDGTVGHTSSSSSSSADGVVTADIKIFTYNGVLSCGGFDCPESTAKCVVTRNTVDNNQNILTVRKCVDSNGNVLAKEESKEVNPNPSASVNTHNESSASGFATQCTGPACGSSSSSFVSSGNVGGAGPASFNIPSAADMHMNAMRNIQQMNEQMANNFGRNTHAFRSSMPDTKFIHNYRGL